MLEREFRCTRSTLYREGSLGHSDLTCRQGHYIFAIDAFDAIYQMAERFPEDLANTAANPPDVFTAEPTGVVRNEQHTIDCDMDEDCTCGHGVGGNVIFAAGLGHDCQDEIGGNVIFRGGVGFTGGSIIFQLPDGSEYFRLDPDGGVFVKGDRATSDMAMYEALKRWLATSVRESGQEDEEAADEL